MPVLTIVLISLNGAVIAINTAESFITNKSVLKVLDEIKAGLQTGISVLGGVHAEHVAQAKEDPAKLNDPDLGGIEAKTDA